MKKTSWLSHDDHNKLDVPSCSMRPVSLLSVWRPSNRRREVMLTTCGAWVLEHTKSDHPICLTSSATPMKTVENLGKTLHRVNLPRAAVKPADTVHHTFLAPNLWDLECRIQRLEQSPLCNPRVECVSAAGSW